MFSLLFNHPTTDDLFMSPERTKTKKLDRLDAEIEELRIARDRAEAEAERFRALISRPYVGLWADEVVVEAAHQRERWPSAEDAKKTPAAWFWLVGYLAGKALAAAEAGDTDKLRHHTVSTAAVLAHWAAYAKGDETVYAPGTTPTDLGIVHENMIAEVRS